MKTKDDNKKIIFTVLVAALGYFVDMYDITLFGVVRVKSLIDLGVQPADQMGPTISLLNWQMCGMLLGGILWGVLGDKKGRLKVLFGSILLYSLANIANSFVTSIEMYKVMRFIAGVGLAGELGAGITLVSEVMSRQGRGYGTALVAAVGLCGSVVAAKVGDVFHWQTAYIVGGVMGLALLVLRIRVGESMLFTATEADKKIPRGDLMLLFGDGPRLRRFLGCIFLGMPIWFITGILITLSPEFLKALGFTETITVGQITLWVAIGLSLGDLASGLLSQALKSRKKVVLLSLIVNLGLILVFLSPLNATRTTVFVLAAVMGFFSGYWAVLVTIAAEQFGTNLRSTVATTVPNFVRASLIPLTFVFGLLKTVLNPIPAVMLLGVCVFGMALLALYNMRETFGANLDFFEAKSGGQLTPAAQNVVQNVTQEHTIVVPRANPPQRPRQPADAEL